MIPKLIHYTWFSGEPMPDNVKDCIASWKQSMPDYEYRLWDSAATAEIDSVFLREALAERKWAFAADVVRLYAVYRYGGIYMDTDVRVYQSFDPLLVNHAFIGRENSMHIIGRSTQHYLSAHCFGAEKGNEFLRRCLHYYDERHFITSPDTTTLPSPLRLDMRTSSEILCVLATVYGYAPSVLADGQQTLRDGIATVYPSHCFDAVKHYPDTYCKHLALGAWRETARRTYNYTPSYKIQWRLRAIVEWVLRRYDYVMIKLR